MSDNKFLNAKKDKYKIRITTTVKGELKNKFVSNCEKRDVKESDLARDIINLHYFIIQKIPRSEYMGLDELKNSISLFHKLTDR